MTLEEAHAPQCLLLEVVSGSHAYGLATPESDLDLKGVFVQPAASFLGIERVSQLNDESNDTVFYELGRFVELLAKGNPNLLEVLFTPPEWVVFRHPLRIYVDSDGAAGYRGVVTDVDAGGVRVSSVPRNVAPIGWMSFNKDGLKKYTKDWRQYRQWIEERNEVRYAQTERHGQGYDAKNLMHTFRLLDLAAEIARDGRLTLRVADPSFLLRIRGGEFGYDWLLAETVRRLAEIEALYAASELPAAPNLPAITGMLVALRRDFWMTSGQLRPT